MVCQSEGGLTVAITQLYAHAMTGTELYKLRKVLRLTQAGLAKAVGVTPNAIALAERGERKIGEPLARLVKLIVKIHKGELVSNRRPAKRRTR